MSKENLDVVFRRDINDDLGYIQERMQAGGLQFSQAAVAQLEAEINASPAFAGKFQFSQVVVIEGNEYYIVGRIDWDYDTTCHKTVANLCDAMQAAIYNDPSVAAAGHFRVVSVQQPANDPWPVPLWRPGV